MKQRPAMANYRAWRRSCLAAIIVFAGPVFSCVNTFEEGILVADADGKISAKAVIAAQIEADHAASPTLENTNDLAVARLVAQRYEDAIALLRDAEKAYPGSAKVAANLGTALELAGKDEEALHWISEGVRRDPTEHFGSEWLHIRILEAKLAIKRDPHWLDSHRVVGVSFGTEDRPIVAPLPNGPDGKPVTLLALREALFHQTQERNRFVDPPNALMGDLMFSFGDAAWLVGRPENMEQFSGDPFELYELAVAFGVARPDLVERRKARFLVEFPGDTWVELAFAGLNIVRSGAKPIERPATDFRDLGMHWVWLAAGAAAVVAALLVFSIRRRAPKT
jgi:hypothetical protein